jgi:hypothetical protein
MNHSLDHVFILLLEKQELYSQMLYALLVSRSVYQVFASWPTSSAAIYFGACAQNLLAFGVESQNVDMCDIL